MIDNCKLRFGIYLVIVSCFLVIGGLASAELIGPTEDPIRIGVGARLMGMGKAFVGVANDGSAVFANPAGIGEMTDWHVLTMYSNVLGDIPYLTLGYSAPMKLLGIKGGWGFAYVGSGVANIPSPTQTGFTYFDYHNNVYLLSLAGRLTDSLSAGINLKRFDEGFTGTVAASGTGLDADIGVKYNHSNWASFGLTVQNALPASMGGKIDWGTYEESVPALLKVGGAFRFMNDHLRLAIDNDLWLSRKLPSQMHAGVEWDINPLLVLRGGVDQSLSSASGGVASNPTFGLGLRMWNARFDYAYHPYFGESGSLTHYFSLSFSPSIYDRTIALATPVPRVVIPPKTPEPPRLKRAREMIPERKEVRPPRVTKPVAKPEVKKKRAFHYVSRGDTLWMIAEKYYGDWQLYPLLAKVNKIKNPDLIFPATWIELPYKLDSRKIILRKK